MARVMRSSILSLGSLILASIVPLATQAQPETTQAPTSLQETWDDWQVACMRREDGGRVCAMAQTQVQEEGRRRILVLEITAEPNAETARGTLVLPFGLDLERGISLEIDDVALADNLRFRTCIPSGCILPIALSAPHLAALRRGGTLTILTAASDTGQPFSFSVSLRGFSAAFNRLVELRR